MIFQSQQGPKEKLETPHSETWSWAVRSQLRASAGGCQGHAVAGRDHLEARWWVGRGETRPMCNGQAESWWSPASRQEGGIRGQKVNVGDTKTHHEPERVWCPQESRAAESTDPNASSPTCSIAVRGTSSRGPEPQGPVGTMMPLRAVVTVRMKWNRVPPQSSASLGSFPDCHKWEDEEGGALPSGARRGVSVVS